MRKLCPCIPDTFSMLFASCIIFVSVSSTIANDVDSGQVFVGKMVAMDSDTLYFKANSLRLNGIDAIEIRQN